MLSWRPTLPLLEGGGTQVTRHAAFPVLYYMMPTELSLS